MLGADKTEALIVTTVVKNISEKRQGILVTPVEVTEKNYMNQIIENIQKYSNISKFTLSMIINLILLFLEIIKKHLK